MKAFFIFVLAATQAFAQGKIEQARKLYEAKKYPEASAMLKNVDDDDKDYAAAQYYLGRIAYDEKNYDDASDYFEEATEANEHVPDYFVWLGNTYGAIATDANVVKQGMLAPKMRNAWEKAIALDSRNVDARISLCEYYMQAPGFMGGSYEKAYAMADQVIALNPAEGHREKGVIYSREKKPAEAEKEFLAMVAADPKYKGRLANFYLGQNQHDKALAIFEENIKKDPQDMPSVYQLGRACAISGQKLDRGEECLRKYLAYQPKQNEPTHAGANMRLGQIYEKRGNKPEAKKHYEVALKMDGTLKEAKEGLQRTSK